MNFPTTPPDQGATKKVKPRVLTAKFGDGYSQRVGDGINAVLEVWDVRFSSRPRTVIKEMDDFLTVAAGVSSFQWKTPHGDTLNFICSEWSTSYSMPLNCSLTATFEQVPG